jgi:hypothetical protein
MQAELETNILSVTISALYQNQNNNHHKLRNRLFQNKKHKPVSVDFTEIFQKDH